MYARVFDFPVCCGTKVIGNFNDFSNSDRIYYYSKIKSLNATTGIGYFVSTFSDTDEQKKAYNEMKAEYKIAWESDWVPNAYMNNDTKVNLVVFECNVMEVD